MAASVNTSGSQTATLDSEHTLATISTAGTYQLVVDADNLANGETLTLKAKVKAYTGQSSKLLWQAVFKHDLGAQCILISPPIPAPIEVVFTLTQSGGTGRAFPWAVYEY